MIDKQTAIVALESNNYNGLPASVVAECIKVIRELPDEGGWISVKDRMPDVDTGRSGYEQVIVIATTGKEVRPLIYERVCFRSKTVRRWKWIWGSIYDGKEITHWMPLPEPPKEEK